MALIFSIIKKETLHIVRDTRTMVITILMPMALLLLFGFAISTEVNDVRVIAVSDRFDQNTRDAIARLESNEYVTFLGMTKESEINYLFRRGMVDAAIIFQHHGSEMYTEVIVDASNPTNGQAAAGYLTSILIPHANTPIITRTLYNPQMRSSFNFVPGIMGMIFILICSIMTSVSIVSEKETGTMDLLIVSPVHSRTIILGKLVPYFVLSLLILALMLTISYTVLDLPFSSTVFVAVGFSLVYISLSLSIGLLVSTLVSTQVAALIVSAMLFMLPVIMLSGMIFPIDNMPQILQYISTVIPARWYIAAMRKLMIQELGITYVWKELLILTGMTIAVLILAIKKFKTGIS